MSSPDRDRTREYKRETYYVLGWTGGEVIAMDSADMGLLPLLHIILLMLGMCLYV